MHIKFLSLFFISFALCGPASGQYLGVQQNIDACLERNEYRACKAALAFTSVNITPGQRRLVEAKVQTLEKEASANRPANVPSTAQPQPARPRFEPGPEGFTKELDYVWENKVKPVLQVLGLIVLVIVGAGVVWLVIIPALQNAKVYANAPAEGPIKLDIETEEVPKTFGGTIHRMHIKVSMSRADQDAMKRSGLESYMLFEFPNPKHPEITLQYCGATLLHVKHVDFPDIQQLHAAKEQLITNLHHLRSRLEQTNEGPTRETIEI